MSAAPPADLYGLPWPEGDPAGLRSVAADLGAVQDQLSAQLVPLRSAAASLDGWAGDARSAFDHATGLAGAGLEDTTTVFQTAAGALSDLALKLEDAQLKVRQAAAGIGEAQEAATRAGHVAESARGTATSLAAGALTPAQAAAAVEADQQAHAAEQRFREAAESARWVASAAYEEARGAVETVHAADRATAGQLDSLSGLVGDRIGPYVPYQIRSQMPSSAGITYAAQGFLALHLAGLTTADWRRIAYRRAGIDQGGWDPALGLLANDHNVQAVYGYYGGLWLENPEFQWAGMANLAGPLFYAGWQDLYVFRSVVDDGDRAQYLRDLTGIPFIPGVDLPGLDDLASGEVKWFEVTFLEMQKEIFDDLAWQHEAYAMGGIVLMRDLYLRGEIEDLQNLEAWENIATGNPDQIALGNKLLLRREQEQIIQDQYDEIRGHHGPVGWAFSEALTWTAENPIPGGRPYGDVFNQQIEILDPTPGIPFVWDPDFAEIEITVPEGNIADFNDRWAWIEQDMFPAYQELLQHPDQMQTIVQTPVVERADVWRKLDDLPYPGG
jgi:hypothetical protein